ncbi:right-handed parallel beta-helix repeat-containing protein [Thalassotalea sp. HSM 43]|uniref:right-handed parallel beta-helix repeat-containing protein n=1 Tax=Thalassotalea sp. HSM 43 TaxID=2552945 RepID=UPI0010807C19|nr:right-handed parallel beta-helix repeat-containing protein [Thalassotalea sp. HSM 43]QBY04211.1 right-handed parallel beta-helix repeat-containing protein [Thalassotalea sp. HSM 43]
MPNLKHLIRLTLSIFISVMCFAQLPATATEYYVNPAIGNDNNSGTSKDAPIKSLDKAKRIKLQAGDKLLFAAGKTYWGSLVLNNLKGSADKPIIVSTYMDDNNSDDAHAKIIARGLLKGIEVVNSSHLQISNFIVTANGGGVYKWQQKLWDKQNGKKKTMMRVGVYVEANKGNNTYSGITFKNMLVRDIFFHDPGKSRSRAETASAMGTEAYGWGFRFFTKGKAKLNNVTVDNSIVYNVAHTGIKFNGVKGNLDNVTLSNNQVLKTGGPGMQMSGVTNAHVFNNKVDESGSTNDTRKWGRGSGMWTWGSSHILVEHNQFLNANGPADSAGFHIDFNCDNVIVQYNLSANNAGGFIEILGNNYNNAYRYNVSVNDGHRVKKKGVAFQEGKTFWLSGFNGKNKPHNGPFNSYIYNNTIYVSDEIVSKIAVTRMAKGALVANNIFHIVGDSKLVKGDQYRPESNGTNHISDVIFTNNIFLKQSNWPKQVLIQDQAPVIADVAFTNPGSQLIGDYTPQNTDVIANKGIEIPFIPGDDKGLFKALTVKHDILGNPIVDKPDIGAIEISAKANQ